jgi:hypothetical protein
VGGGMLWRNGCDGKVLRCGAGIRHQQLRLENPDVTVAQDCTRTEGAVYHTADHTINWPPFSRRLGSWGWGLVVCGTDRTLRSTGA